MCRCWCDKGSVDQRVVSLAAVWPDYAEGLFQHWDQLKVDLFAVAENAHLLTFFTLHHHDRGTRAVNALQQQRPFTVMLPFACHI